MHSLDRVIVEFIDGCLARAQRVWGLNLSRFLMGTWTVGVITMLAIPRPLWAVPIGLLVWALLFLAHRLELTSPGYRDNARLAMRLNANVLKNREIVVRPAITLMLLSVMLASYMIDLLSGIERSVFEWVVRIIYDAAFLILYFSVCATFHVGHPRKALDPRMVPEKL